jgi:uncharacterized protein
MSKIWPDYRAACLDALKKEWGQTQDSAHDLAHIMRVEAAAKQIATAQEADLNIVMPAVWLHDLINLPKDHPQRHEASRMSAEKGADILSNLGYDEAYLKPIQHAIAAHSFSVGITPETIEAKVVQDADRLDALGAIGIARCFAVSGSLGRGLIHPYDPLCEDREPDDVAFAVDHFYVKLFKLPETMQTQTGKAMAKSRVDFMRDFLQQIKTEQVS